MTEAGEGGQQGSGSNWPWCGKGRVKLRSYTGVSDRAVSGFGDKPWRMR